MVSYPTYSYNQGVMPVQAVEAAQPQVGGNPLPMTMNQPGIQAYQAPATTSLATPVYGPALTSGPSYEMMMPTGNPGCATCAGGAGVSYGGVGASGSVGYSGVGARRAARKGPYSFMGCLKTDAVVPPPIGSAVVSIFEMQRVAAMSEFFVIYIEDWLDDTAVLNDTGIRHLNGIARRFNDSGAPVKIEPYGKDEIDAPRKAAIMDLLIKAGHPQFTVTNRVVGGNTRAEGLRERYMEAVYFRGLAQMFSGGFGGGGFGGGGFGGGGFGGGGFGGGGGGFGGGFR